MSRCRMGWNCSQPAACKACNGATHMCENTILFLVVSRFFLLFRSTSKTAKGTMENRERNNRIVLFATSTVQSLQRCDALELFNAVTFPSHAHRSTYLCMLETNKQLAYIYTGERNTHKRTCASTQAHCRQLGQSRRGSAASCNAETPTNTSCPYTH